MLYQKELQLLQKKERLRIRQIYNDKIIDLASNDYLGLAENKEILEKAYLHIKNFKSHASKASQLVNGYHYAHKLLEDKLKKLNNFEDALIVGSGFLANMALFELGRKGDIFLVDEEYHASGIIGTKITNAEVRFFKHNDLNDLQNKSKDYKKFNRVFVVVEGIYSMKGDKVTKEITTFAQSIGVLIIDEAHSVGVCGNRLMGITDEYNLDTTKTVKMGTLGKALGSYGAYILASKEIISYLINRAKSIIYTTALSPFNSLVAYYSLNYIQHNLLKLKREINYKKRKFQTQSLIKILEAKSNQQLLQKQQLLLKKNILIGAIRPPTVPTPIFRIILRLPVKNNIISKTIKEIG